jgi:hypothetical protein
LVGELIGDTLFKDVQPYHFMRVVGGYGINEDAFQDILSKGCKKIVIKEVNTGKRWEGSVKDWQEHCHIADYGSGKQRFLGLKYMHTHKIDLDIPKGGE